MSDKAQTIALIGGGRWGRVHAQNLSQLLGPQDRVFWVSRHNQQALHSEMQEFSKGGPAFELSASIGDAISQRPHAALIVTSPQTHFSVSQECLRAGVHAFVEKPLAFTVAEARSLISMAEERNLLLALGLHLLSASYLHHFVDQLASRPISKIVIRWFDPAHEIRYGESKQANESTPLVHDIYPHIWSIVRAITGCTLQTIDTASTHPDRSISFVSRATCIKVDAHFGRYSVARERKIDIEFVEGGTGSLDFTQEPGTAAIDNAPLPADPHWGKAPRPVMAEVQDFLKRTALSVRDPAWPHLAANCIDSVAGAEAVQAKLT